MRKALLFLPLFFLLSVAVYAEKVQVVTEEYPPYNYTDSGKVTGMSTEVVKLVLKEAKVEYAGIQSAPWARVYNTALTQPNILIYSIGRSQEREAKFKWVGIIAPYDVYLFKLKENTALKLSSLDGAKGKKTGVVRDDVRAQYLKGKGFSDIDLDIGDNDSMNLMKLFAHRIDMFPIDEVGASFLAQQRGFDFSKMEKVFYLKELSSGLYMAFSKETPDDVVVKCKAALEKIKKDGRFDQIKNKYIK
jgi:polar amino acid transport system substrate-binding protein